MGIIIAFLIGIFVFAIGLFSQIETPFMLHDNLEELQTGWTVTSEQYNNNDITIPTTINNIPLGETVTLKKLLPMNLSNDACLFFRSSQQNVKVIVNGDNLYEYGHNDKRIYGKTSASVWNIVPDLKNYEGKIVEIQLTGIYKPFTGLINQVYIGSESDIVAHILMERLPSVIVSLFLFLFGVTVIIVTLVLKKEKSVQSLFRLAVFSVLVGIWSCCTTNVLQLFVGNVFCLLNLEFLAFLLLLPVALWMIDSFERFSNSKFLHTLFWISIITCVLTHILQVFNIADYMNSLLPYHILMLVTILYLIIVIMREHIGGGVTREIKTLSISLLQIMVFAIIDIIKFYFYKYGDDGFFTRIGFLLFIIIWASMIIENMSKLLVNTTRTRILEELAYKDLMTGLKNRTAFEEKLDELRVMTAGETYVIACDMNNLKRVNDNFGHSMGDTMIKECANAILKEWQNYGICYRTGGDEFCILIEDSDVLSEDMLSEKLDALKKEISNIGNSVDISLACGYAKITIGHPDDIDKAYRLADGRMYADKEIMKSGD